MNDIPNKKICIFATNDINNDPRVQRIAKTAHKSGLEAIVIGLSYSGKREEHSYPEYRKILLPYSSVFYVILYSAYFVLAPKKFLEHIKPVFVGLYCRSRSLVFKVLYSAKQCLKQWAVLLIKAILPNSAKAFLKEKRDSFRALMQSKKGKKDVPRYAGKPSSKDAACSIENDNSAGTADNSYKKIKDAINKYRSRWLNVMWMAASRYSIHRQMLKEAVSIGACIYYANDLDTLACAVLAARKDKAKVIYDNHELWVDMFVDYPVLFNKIASFIENRYIRRADEVVCVNSGIGEALKKKYGIKKYTVMMNSPYSKEIEHMDRIKFRNIMGIGQDEFIFLYQGRYERGRGLEELVQSAQYLERGVIVFRGYGVNEPELKALASKLDLLNKKVFFLDPVPMDELVREATVADVGIIPYRPVSRNNMLCSPNKLFEYMQARLALAVSDLPVLRQIVNDEKCGVLFDPESPSDISAKLNSLSADRKRMEEFSQNSLLASRRTYNWEYQSSKLEKIFMDEISK